MEKVLSSLSRKTEIIFLPYLNGIINFQEKEICDKLENSSYSFPNVVKRLCNGEK